MSGESGMRMPTTEELEDAVELLAYAALNMSDDLVWAESVEYGVERSNGSAANTFRYVVLAAVDPCDGGDYPEYEMLDAALRSWRKDMDGGVVHDEPNAWAQS
jgi:hypothetical protein